MLCVRDRFTHGQRIGPFLYIPVERVLGIREAIFPVWVFFPLLLGGTFRSQGEGIHGGLAFIHAWRIWLCGVNFVFFFCVSFVLCGFPRGCRSCVLKERRNGLHFPREAFWASTTAQ